MNDLYTFGWAATIVGLIVLILGIMTMADFYRFHVGQVTFLLGGIGVTLGLNLLFNE